MKKASGKYTSAIKLTVIDSGNYGKFLNFEVELKLNDCRQTD
jgi:hypothetical protein